MALDRLSLNQITIDQWTLAEAVEGCVRAGVPFIGPWRQRVAEAGLGAGARLIRDSGLRVSSLCRGGFFPAATDADRRRADDDNRDAVDEAAALGTDVLVLVCGPPIGGDLGGARAMIAAGIERLVPYAAERGVRLAIEPLHPMMVGERSAIVTLGEANDLAERFDRRARRRDRRRLPRVLGPGARARDRAGGSSASSASTWPTGWCRHRICSPAAGCSATGSSTCAESASPSTPRATTGRSRSR